MPAGGFLVNDTLRRALRKWKFGSKNRLPSKFLDVAVSE
ncbi:hypothetical protein ES703_43056 [subsurface metagenome]